MWDNPARNEQGSFSREADREAACGHGLRAGGGLLLPGNGGRMGRDRARDAGIPHGRRLYRGRIVPRRDADDAFRDMMKRRGRIRAWKRRRIWLGVRLFGWIAWLRHTPEGVAEARRHIQLAFADGGKRTTTRNKKGKKQ